MLAIHCITIRLNYHVSIFKNTGVAGFVIRCFPMADSQLILELLFFTHKIAKNFALSCLLACA